jgi:hypothetical protein
MANWFYPLKLKRDEWTFSNLPRNSGPQLKDLNAEMTVVNFVEQKKSVRPFKLAN